uniref:Uncharacterized protein n=1 Tax=Rhizophora mucronata TaxID=61149 RepID=A0A2P2NVB0_RHIMU
MRFFFFLI